MKKFLIVMAVVVMMTMLTACGTEKRKHSDGLYQPPTKGVEEVISGSLLESLTPSKAE